MSAELIKPFEFYSYFSLYSYLVENGLAGEKSIDLERVIKPPEVSRKKAAYRMQTERVTLDLDFIKVRAFEELYEKLPTIKHHLQAQKIRDSLQQACFIDLDFFHQFLSLPCRVTSTSPNDLPFAAPNNVKPHRQAPPETNK